MGKSFKEFIKNNKKDSFLRTFDAALRKDEWYLIHPLLVEEAARRRAGISWLSNAIYDAERFKYYVDFGIVIGEEDFLD
jgi:hypothetical protein